MRKYEILTPENWRLHADNMSVILQQELTQVGTKIKSVLLSFNGWIILDVPENNFDVFTEDHVTISDELGEIGIDEQATIKQWLQKPELVKIESLVKIYFDHV